MDFNKIIEYQKKDEELIKIERDLNNNVNKKVFSEMIAVVKKAQEKSSHLENKAQALINEYNSLKKAYEDNLAQIEKFISKNLENLSQKDLENILNASSAITNNLNILEKKLFNEAENFNITLNEFEQAKKQYGYARAKYNDNKQKYEQFLKEKEPIIQEIKNQLRNLERGIDSKLINKYKQLRSDKLFPVFVGLNERSCGGCMMELSAAEIEKVKNIGYIECDNCHRIIINN